MRGLQAILRANFFLIPVETNLWWDNNFDGNMADLPATIYFSFCSDLIALLRIFGEKFKFPSKENEWGYNKGAEPDLKPIMLYVIFQFVTERDVEAFVFPVRILPVVFGSVLGLLEREDCSDWKCHRHHHPRRESSQPPFIPYVILQEWFSPPLGRSTDHYKKYGPKTCGNGFTRRNS